MKKIISNVMALAMLAGLTCGVTACGQKVVEDLDTTKTQLFIGSYNGGGGYKWLDDAAARFEEKYAGTSFEDGKTGVQIIIDHNKSYTSLNVGSNNDLIFAGSTVYYDLITNKVNMDMTDVVTGVSTFDNKTIESKLDDATKDALKVDGKYYALPYYEAYSGVSYDADLFNEYKLYFSNELDTSDTTYPGTNKFVTAKNATNLSCGPDAVFGTYDDGLPSTYQEFYKLMDKMIKGTGGKKITPFAFHNSHYTNTLMHALAANYVGADGWRTNFEFNSNGKEVEIVKSFNGNQPEVEKVVLTQDNAYKIKSSLGLYYASEFCQKVYSNSQYYDLESAKESSTNLATQERFMKSGWDPSSPTPIAMLIEGSYWYNEAEQEGIFDRARKLDPNRQNGIKDVKFMPMPHQYAGTVTPSEDGKAVSQVLVDVGNSYAFICAGLPSEHVEVAKLFLSFCYSDDELEKAELSNNGVARGLNYSTANIQDELSGYAKSINTMRVQAENNNAIMKNIAQNSIYMKNANYFKLTTASDYWNCSLDTVYAHAYLAYSTKRCSAKEYFLGLALSENTWKNSYLK